MTNHEPRIWLKGRDEPLYCRNGHRIARDTVVLDGHGRIVCTARINSAADDRPRECGEMYWMYVCPGFRIIARVTDAEMRIIEEQRLDVGGVMDLLNIKGVLLPLGTQHALEMRPRDHTDHSHRRRA